MSVLWTGKSAKTAFFPAFREIFAALVIAETRKLDTIMATGVGNYLGESLSRHAI